MKVPKKTIGALGGVIILGIVLWATGALKISLTYHTTDATAPENEKTTQERQTTTTDKKEWMEYRSTVHGFAMWYPGDWTIDDSQTATPSIRFVAPGDKAQLIIGVIGDERLKQQGGATAVIEDIRAGFEDDKRYMLERFEELNEDSILLAGGYLAKGSYDDGKQATYRFKEIGILLADGRGFIETGNVLTDSTAEYGGVVDYIFASFDPFGQRSRKPELEL